MLPASPFIRVSLSSSAFGSFSPYIFSYFKQILARASSSAPLSSYSLIGFFLFFIGVTASIAPCPLQKFTSRYSCHLLVSPSSYIEQQLGVFPDIVFPSQSWSSHRSFCMEIFIQYSYFGILELSSHCNLLSLMITEWRGSVRMFVC
jgi:hypothetical protein